MSACVCVRVGVFMCEFLGSTEQKKEEQNKTNRRCERKTLLPHRSSIASYGVCTYLTISPVRVFLCCSAAVLYTFVWALNFTFIESNDFILVLIYEYYY